MVSLATTTAASGSSSLGATASSRLVRVGLQPGDLGRGRSPAPVGGGTSARTRAAAPSASRQALVAIRYSQARNVERPCEASRRLRQARRNVSCTRSSASSSEPSIR